MDKELPKMLESLREEKKWSKTYVAEKLGINSLSTYANYEYGNRSPSNEMLIKIGELYNVSVDYLLGRTSNPRPISNNRTEDEFLNAINDRDLKRWFLELPKTDEEELKKLRLMWDLVTGEKEEK